MPTTILIDGDIFAYKHAAGSEIATDWGDDIWTLWSDIAQAKQQLDADIRSIAKELEATTIIIALTGSENFRKQIAPTYKQARKSTRKPMGLPALKDFLVTEYTAQPVEPLEADDLMGIWATDPEVHKGSRKIIVSTDKDMRTIPCELWNPNKPELGVQKITKAHANHNHLMQTLIGDSTDGYGGCPTIGPARAERLLTKESSWDTVVTAYQAQGLTSEDAVVQGQLARILRVDNYEPVTKKITHWKP